MLSLEKTISDAAPCFPTQTNLHLLMYDSPSLFLIDNKMIHKDEWAHQHSSTPADRGLLRISVRDLFKEKNLKGTNNERVC
jgi:hypothetical protein